MTLQRFEPLTVFQTDDEIRCDGFLDRNGRLLRRCFDDGRRAGASREITQRAMNGIDQRR